MISAPTSASSAVQYGPASTRVKSSIRTFASGSEVVWRFIQSSEGRPVGQGGRRRPGAAYPPATWNPAIYWIVVSRRSSHIIGFDLKFFTLEP